MGQFDEKIANFKLDKSKFLWLLFYIELTVILLVGFETLFDFDFAKTELITLAELLPLILVILHSIWTLSFPRGLFFLFFAALVGFIGEFASLNSFFHASIYKYNASLVTFLNVPLVVIVYWVVLTYLGYSLVNSFLFWLGKNKPSLKDKNFYLLPVLVVADGLVVVAIDLFMDPIEVKAGVWTWLVHGAYFGVPISNFLGWFNMIILITAIFRLYEYFTQLKTNGLNKSVFLIPVFGYATLALYLGISAIMFGMYTLALIGSLLMLPTAIVNLFLYRYSQ